MLIITPHITAINEPGIVLMRCARVLFQINNTRRDMTPIIRTLYERETVSGCVHENVPAVTPRRVGSCFIMRVIPIAANIPLMTLTGTYLFTLLAFKSQKRTCRAHAMITDTRNWSNPNVLIALTTIATSHAAGPLTLSGDLLRVHTTIPHIIPEITPLIRGAPLAIAIHKHNGTATRKTANHAGISYLRLLNIGVYLYIGKEKVRKSLIYNSIWICNIKSNKSYDIVLNFVFDFIYCKERHETYVSL